VRSGSDGIKVRERDQTALAGKNERRGRHMAGQLGRSGRTPKPSAIKRAGGNPGKRRLSDDLVGIGKPILPPNLGELELFLWHATISSIPAGVLTSADSAILECFVCAWARFRECRRQIARSGLLVRAETGAVRNPLLLVLNQAERSMNAAATQLGLSPVARARLANPAVENDYTMAWLLDENPDLLN
jgi:P27 family predicted phage terminase small subunit